MSRTYRGKTPIYDGTTWESTKDKKKWYKPGKIFKQLQKRKRKAKEKAALILEKEVIPDFPKTDQWDYN